MRTKITLLLLPCLLACGQPSSNGGSPGGGGRGGWGNKRKEYALPVRTEAPSRAPVMDYVETQATLESEDQVAVYAEVDGKIVERVRDVGDRVGEAKNGEDPLLLARIDDRDLALALKDAGIKLKEIQGRIRELELDKQRAERELEQAKVTGREADAAYRRTSEGIKDGTISIEEHEKATFALRLAEKKVLAAETALEQADVALELGAVAVEAAQVARDRAALALERATLRAPRAGVVTVCNVREGERVRTGDLLFRIEAPQSLIVYADLPVRQASRVDVGDAVTLASTAIDGTTNGEVVLVSPTVQKESGTVRVKVQVTPAEGFKPGLFVTLKIVVATRDGALVVPKRAILHDDEEGAYLFTVAEKKAQRILVRTGFEGDGVIEVLEGIGEDAQVVVEGQDTLSDGAKVDVQQ